MATQLLAVGTTAADSADQVLTAGTMLCLKDAAGTSVLAGAFVDISVKDDVGQYFRIGALTGARPAMVINGSGTYRFSRRAGASCGVFSA
jgi:hypothetical protein